MTTRILFVCLGNICRSASAEGVFRVLAAGQGFVIDSAGASDWHVGEPPYGPMQMAAKARGFDLSSQSARHFEADDFTKFDLIIGMDADNLTEIENLRPAGNATQVVLFTDYARRVDADHVPDPYYTQDFDGVLDLIEEASRGLLAALSGQA